MSKLDKQEVDYKVNNGKVKQVSSVIKTIVDSETGEVIQQECEKVFTTKVKTDNFFMCFFENFGALYGLKNLSDIKLITCMCELAEFNTGIVKMTTKTRKTISEKTSISLTNMSKNLKRLMNADLISEELGDYTINPAVFWKGSITERTSIIRNGGLNFQIRLVEEAPTKTSKMKPSKEYGE